MPGAVKDPNAQQVTLQDILGTTGQSLIGAGGLLITGAVGASITFPATVGVTGQVSAALQATADGNGLSTFFRSAMSAVWYAAKTAPGKLHGWELQNPNTAAYWLQLFDLPSASATGGVTVPKKSLWVPAAGYNDHHMDLGITFLSGILMFVSTDSTGSAQPSNSTGMIVNLDFI